MNWWSDYRIALRFLVSVGAGVAANFDNQVLPPRSHGVKWGGTGGITYPWARFEGVITHPWPNDILTNLINITHNFRFLKGVGAKFLYCEYHVPSYSLTRFQNIAATRVDRYLSKPISKNSIFFKILHTFKQIVYNPRLMGRILDGRSEIGAHLVCKIGNLVCLRLLFWWGQQLQFWHRFLI